MFNISVSAIAGSFVFVCLNDPQESAYLAAIGWALVSGYFFLCSLIEQFKK
jgi:hypothetical protein